MNAPSILFGSRGLRRLLLAALAAALVTPALSCRYEEAPVEDLLVPGYRIFVGTATGEEDEGIYAFRFDVATGALAFERKTAGVLDPSFLALSPDQRVLYSVHRDDGRDDGAVSAFRVDPETGALTLLNRQSTGGQGPCYVSTDRDGRWVLVANYGSGTVAVFPVSEDGSLGEAGDVVQHTGSSVDPERQTGPHAHYVNVDPRNRFVFAVDLGIDRVMVYTIDDRGRLMPHETPWAALSPGAGPRHLDVHPNGRYVYVMNELAGSVTAFAYDAEQGRLTEIQTLSALPEGFDGYNKSADIHVHPSGRFLYASNRGDADGITVFAVDEATGRLTVVDHEHEGIVWPRNFAIDPTGAFLLVANRNDDSIVVFRIDAASGRLMPTGHAAEVPGPMCIRFSGPLATP